MIVSSSQRRLLIFLQPSHHRGELVSGGEPDAAGFSVESGGWPLAHVVRESSDPLHSLRGLRSTTLVRDHRLPRDWVGTGWGAETRFKATPSCTGVIEQAYFYFENLTVLVTSGG